MHNFTAKDLPPAARPWPPELAEPAPLESGAHSVPGLADGVYYSCHPGGQLRFVGRVEDGGVRRWLTLANGVNEGCKDTPNAAQKYYRNGRMEDFTPWSENDPAYPATMPFYVWVRNALDMLAAPTPKAPKPPPPQTARKGDYPPQAERISSCGQLPKNLPEMLVQVESYPWSASDTSVHELNAWMVDTLGWSAALARDVCSFGVAACARAETHVDNRQQSEVFLSPLWDGSATHREAPLRRVSLYARVQDLAETFLEKGGRGHQRWVGRLAAVNPVSATSRQKLPHPVVWTVPPKNTCSFWMAMVCIDLLLRQEQSRGTELSAYLQEFSEAEANRFYRYASLAGAFLQAPYATGCLYFHPGQRPWKGRRDWLDYPADLADLIASLGDGPLLPGLGAWVQRKTGGADGPVVQLLGRFFHIRSRMLVQRLRAAATGGLYWDRQEPQGWPRRGELTQMHEDRQHRPESYANKWRRLFQERAGEFQEAMRLSTTLSNFESGAFGHRLTVAGLHLMQGQPLSSGLDRQLADELGKFLADHPALPPSQQEMLSQLVVGVPTTPGTGYIRLLTAAYWVLSAFPHGHADDANLIRLAVSLAHWMLQLFEE